MSSPSETYTNAPPPAPLSFPPTPIPLPSPFQNSLLPPPSPTSPLPPSLYPSVSSLPSLCHSAYGAVYRAALPKSEGDEDWAVEGAEISLQAILDSGSNITLMSEAVAQQLDTLGKLRVIERKTPLRDLGRVRFGKRGALADIVMVVRGGGLLETVAVVADIDVCLVSVGWFTRARDMHVTFTAQNVDLTYNGVTISQGVYDDKLGMYVFDMLQLLTAPDPRSLPAISQPTQAFTSRRVPRFKQAAVLKALTLHKNLGCLPFETMAVSLERKAWQGVDSDITPALCRELARKKSCLTCALSRWRQEKLEGSGVMQSFSPADVGKYIVTDLCGKFTPPSHGCSYFQYVGCPLTKYHKVYGQSSPTQALASIRQWIILCLQLGHVPKYLLNDNGSVEASDLAAECYARWGVKGIATPSKIPLFSVEREVQLKLDDIEALLLTHPFWTAANWLDAAIKSAQNRSYSFNSSSLLISPTKTPFELFTRHPPPMQCFDRFGTGDIVVAQTAIEERKVGQPRNQMGLVLEVKDDGSKASELLMPGKSRVLDRGNLQKVHIEPPPTPRVVSVIRAAQGSLVTVSTSDDVDCSSPKSLSDYQLRLQQLKVQQEDTAIANAAPLLQRIEQQATIRDRILAEHALDSQEDERTDAGTYLPGPQRDYWPMEELATFISSLHLADSDIEESSAFWTSLVDTSYRQIDWQTVQGIHAYRAAYGRFPPLPPPSPPSDASLSQLGTNNLAFAVSLARNYDESPTGGRIERSPELQRLWKPAMVKEVTGWLRHAKQISEAEAKTKGVTPHVTTFTTKRGTGQRKVRITFHGGYELRTNPEFRDHRYRLFAPAMDTDLFLFLLAFATYFKLSRSSSDVTQCFMENDMAHATFKRDLVVYLSEWECGVKGGAFYLIDSVLYGCPDASMEWHKRLREFLMGTIKMTVSVFNPCLFILLLPPSSLILCGTATDNLEFFSTANSPTREKLQWIRAQLDAKWPMTHEEEARDVLGFAICKHPDGGVHVTQPNTVTAVERFFFPDGSVPKTIVPELPGYRTPNPESLAPADLKRYQCGLGIMVYARGTRKDLMVVFSQLAERSLRPRLIDWEALVHAAAYLSTTREVGLSYFPGPSDADISSPLPHHSYADASWNSSEDFASRLGRMICPGHFPQPQQLVDHRVSAPFFAKSGKEEGVHSTSVCQAELKSAVLCVADISVYRGMTEEIAGVADGSTLSDVPDGAAPPSQLRASMAHQLVADSLPSSPTILAQDNRSLVIAAGQDVAKKSKGLRHMYRSLACIRSSVREGLIQVISVPASEQRANPLTKAHTSPSMHWKEVEFLQGSQPAVLSFQQQAATYGELKKSPRQLNEVVRSSILEGEERQLNDWSDVMDVELTLRNTAANASQSEQSQGQRLEVS